MSDFPREPRAPRRSPQVIRSATFSQRRRGFDEDEVRAFLDRVAGQVEAAEAECADLRAEADRLRAEVDRLRIELRDREDSPPEVNERAVALFSQAQQVADRLVEEAVQHARDLMSAARSQEREIIQRAHEAAEAAAREAGARSPGGAAGHGGSGYDVPVSEIEYVRTFARVAQVQFRSVLEALSEQVDRLGQVPDLPEGRRSHRSADVSWQLEAGPVEAGAGESARIEYARDELDGDGPHPGDRRWSELGLG
ncbi:DivIVA domain-containing protein [Actinopolymorpha singaporensis]